jgi:hypothetical protein
MYVLIHCVVSEYDDETPCHNTHLLENLVIKQINYLQETAQIYSNIF